MRPNRCSALCRHKRKSSPQRTPIEDRSYGLVDHVAMRLVLRDSHLCSTLCYSPGRQRSPHRFLGGTRSTSRTPQARSYPEGASHPGNSLFYVRMRSQRVITSVRRFDSDIASKYLTGAHRYAMRPPVWRRLVASDTGHDAAFIARHVSECV